MISPIMSNSTKLSWTFETNITDYNQEQVVICSHFRIIRIHVVSFYFVHSTACL
jgi:hypothetical protein